MSSRLHLPVKSEINLLIICLEWKRASLKEIINLMMICLRSTKPQRANLIFTAGIRWRMLIKLLIELQHQLRLDKIQTSLMLGVFHNQVFFQMSMKSKKDMTPLTRTTRVSVQADFKCLKKGMRKKRRIITKQHSINKEVMILMLLKQTTETIMKAIIIH